MRTDELRTLLENHADDAAAVHRVDPATRVGAVHARVAARVRRRRTAVVVGAAVVALVAAVAMAVPALRHDASPQPVDRTPGTLAGRPVPRTWTAEGQEYDYARGVQSRPGARRLGLDVPVGDAPKLVMWATSDDGTAPTLRLRGPVPAAVKGPRTPAFFEERGAPGPFQRYLYLPAWGEAYTERMTLTRPDAGPHDVLALAVFDVSDRPPPGVTAGGVTYRRTVLDARLVDATFGERGQSEVSLTVRLPREPVAWVEVCFGSELDYVLMVAGRQVRGGDCDPQSRPGEVAGFGDGASSPRLGLPPGRRVTATVRLVHNLDNRAGFATDPGVLLGLGVYTLDSRIAVAGSEEVPAGLENFGHEWAEQATREAPPGRARLRLVLEPAAQPRQVWFVGVGMPARAQLRLRADGDVVARTRAYELDSAGMGFGIYVHPGEHPVLDLTTDTVGGRGRLGFVVYRPTH